MWSTSTRAQRLPADWRRRRDQVKSRAKGKCEAKAHAPGCTGIGAECDHIIPGDDHSLHNLQWLSNECHDAKTKREAREARKAQRSAKIRPAERHPGALR